MRLLQMRQQMVEVQRAQIAQITAWQMPVQWAQQLRMEPVLRR